MKIIKPILLKYPHWNQIKKYLLFCLYIVCLRYIFFIEYICTCSSWILFCGNKGYGCPTKNHHWHFCIRLDVFWNWFPSVLVNILSQTNIILASNIYILDVI